GNHVHDWSVQPAVVSHESQVASQLLCAIAAVPASNAHAPGEACHEGGNENVFVDGCGHRKNVHEHSGHSCGSAPHPVHGWNAQHHVVRRHVACDVRGRECNENVRPADAGFVG